MRRLTKEFEANSQKASSLASQAVEVQATRLPMRTSCSKPLDSCNAAIFAVGFRSHTHACAHTPPARQATGRHQRELAELSTERDGLAARLQAATGQLANEEVRFGGMLLWFVPLSCLGSKGSWHRLLYAVPFALVPIRR